MDVPARINELRIHFGLSIRKLAAMADMPASTLTSIINGEDNDTQVGNIVKICEALNLTLAEFFTPSAGIYHKELSPESRLILNKFEAFLLHEELTKQK